MTLSRKTLRLGAVLTALAVLAWQGEDGVRPRQPTVELVVSPDVRLGDTVAITLRVRNDGPEPVDLQLPGRPVAFDVVIVGPDGAEVWRRLRGTVTGSALMLLHLAPGQARDFTVQWTQVDNDGRPVPAGRYRVKGVLPVGTRQLTTAPRELVIMR